MLIFMKSVASRRNLGKKVYLSQFLKKDLCWEEMKALNPLKMMVKIMKEMELLE